MNHLEYFQEVNAQKQIDKLAKKYKDKKVVIYGGGAYFNTLKNNFDMSKLNIIGIADKKFEKSKNQNNTPYTPIAPKELKDIDYDVILVSALNFYQIDEYLRYQILINEKSKRGKIKKLIKPTFLHILKSFID